MDILPKIPKCKEICMNASDQFFICSDLIKLKVNNINNPIN